MPIELGIWISQSELEKLDRRLRADLYKLGTVHILQEIYFETPTLYRWLTEPVSPWLLIRNEFLCRSFPELGQLRSPLIVKSVLQQKEITLCAPEPYSTLKTNRAFANLNRAVRYETNHEHKIALAVIFDNYMHHPRDSQSTIIDSLKKLGQSTSSEPQAPFSYLESRDRIRDAMEYIPFFPDHLNYPL